MKKLIVRAFALMFTFVLASFNVIAQEMDSDSFYSGQSFESVLSHSGGGSTLPPALFKNALLGDAYHSNKKAFMGTIVAAGNVRILNSSMAHFDSEWNEGIDGMLWNITGGIANYRDFPIYKLGDDGRLAADFATNLFSKTYTLTTNLTAKHKVLDLQGVYLTEEGDEIADEDEDELFEDAGDEYLSCITYGATAVLNLKFYFRNLDDKKNIAHTIRFVSQNGKTVLNPEIKIFDELTRQSVKIKAQVIQKGGEPSAILNIIPQEMQCDLLNPEPCIDAFQEALLYVKNDFTAQLNSIDDYVPVRYQTARYDTSVSDIRKLVPPTGYPYVPTSTHLTISELNSLLMDISVAKHRVKDLLEMYKTDMTNAQYEKILRINEIVLRNEDLYIQNMESCLNDPLGDSCKNKFEITKTMVDPYLMEDLSI